MAIQPGSQPTSPFSTQLPLDALNTQSSYPPDYLPQDLALLQQPPSDVFVPQNAPQNMSILPEMLPTTSYNAKQPDAGQNQTGLGEFAQNANTLPQDQVNQFVELTRLGVLAQISGLAQNASPDRINSLNGLFQIGDVGKLQPGVTKNS